MISLQNFDHVTVTKLICLLNVELAPITFPGMRLDSIRYNVKYASKNVQRLQAIEN
jgi:hypothetical protein